MKTAEFNKIVKAKANSVIKTLTEKGRQYSTEDDRLHNFHIGQSLTGLTTPQQVLSKYDKHIIALYDAVFERNEVLKNANPEEVKEFCDEILGDIRCYSYLAEAAILEHYIDNKPKVSTEKDTIVSEMITDDIKEELIFDFNHRNTVLNDDYLILSDTDSEMIYMDTETSEYTIDISDNFNLENKPKLILRYKALNKFLHFKTHIKIIADKIYRYTIENVKETQLSLFKDLTLRRIEDEN